MAGGPAEPAAITVEANDYAAADRGLEHPTERSVDRVTQPLERLSTALTDRYRLERELRAGGMATVYLAQNLKHDRHVAMRCSGPSSPP